MRKRIALILAVAMLFSVIMPMSVSAASDNSISRTPTVADDRQFKHDDSDLPLLRIEEDESGDFAYGETQVFRLNLSNAEWVFGDNDLENNIQNYSDWNAALGNINDTDWNVSITRRTDTSITVRAEWTDDQNDAERLTIPMLAELDGEGEARVTIDPMNSALSPDTLTFAIGASGDTTAFVDSTETIRRGANQTAGAIIIDETTAGALSDDTRQGFRLRLPNNFSWGDMTNVRFEGLNVSGNVTEVDSTNAGDIYEFTRDGRDLIVRFDLDNVSTTRGSIIIEPNVTVSRDANFGDVNVSLTGFGDISNASSLTIAEYKDFGVDYEVEEDGEKEFFVGRLFDNNDEEYSIEFTIEETVDNSFIAGRTIDFSVPDWMWITEVEVDEGTQNNLDLDENGDNEFEYSVATGEDELTFIVYFTLEGTAAVDGPRDIPMTISGAGIDAMDIVLGIAKPSVEVEIAEQTAELSIGEMAQDAPEIVVTETEAGALIEGGDLELWIVDFFGGSIKFDAFDYEVVEGDIELTSKSTGDQRLKVEVDAESTEASTIRFYNIKLDVDRSAPRGWYKADVRGTAVVENNAEVGRAENYTYGDADIEDILEEADFVSRVFRGDYVSIGTPIDLQTPVARERVVMTVGQTTYMVGDEQMVMDVAPFVQDDRLMVPVAHVSRALGVSRNAVVWDGEARTVTIYADKVMQMEIGSRTMVVNGVPSDMGAAAVIVGDRTFVPVSRFARALGIDYTWDAATQTVTFHEEE